MPPRRFAMSADDRGRVKTPSCENPAQHPALVTYWRRAKRNA